MYSKQAIKSFKKQLKDNIHHSDMLLTFNIKETISLIEQSQKYHMGSDDFINAATKLMKKYKGKETKPFMGELADSVKLPFNQCWFDFIDDNLYKHLVGKDGKPIKVGMCVRKCNPDKPKNYPEILYVSTCFSYDSNPWRLCGNSFYVKVGDTFTYNEAKDILTENVNCENKNLVEFVSIIKEATEKNYIFIPTVKFNGEKDTQSWLELSLSISGWANKLLNSFLLVLHCQNVVTETVSTNKKPHKKKFKNKGITYKVLKFKLPKSGKKYLSDKSENNLTTMPLTMCAGHYKTYTEDAPLFGKIVGRWWWNNHMRGNKANGIIEKEYYAEYDE